mgnify:CR=1 FL=1
MAKKALGKGLGALISSSSISKNSPAPKEPKASTRTSGESVELVALDQIIPSTLQPRREFGPAALSELVNSIREHGIIQPLIVRKKGELLELIAGERRWRASRELGLQEIPVIVREASDQDVLEMALIENLQRQDLNPIDEAAGYARLVKEFKLKQVDIAKRVGKSRASVANAMRLLDLSDELQAWVADTTLSVGHAKAILSLKEEKPRQLVAEQVIQRSLTVRQTEKLIQELKDGKLKPKKKPSAPKLMDPRFEKVSKILSEQLATPVQINSKGKNGRIEIGYSNDKELVRILELLGIDGDEVE